MVVLSLEVPGALVAGLDAGGRGSELGTDTFQVEAECEDVFGVGGFDAVGGGRLRAERGVGVGMLFGGGWMIADVSIFSYGGYREGSPRGRRWCCWLRWSLRGVSVFV